MMSFSFGFCAYKCVLFTQHALDNSFATRAFSYSGACQFHVLLSRAAEGLKNCWTLLGLAACLDSVRVGKLQQILIPPSVCLLEDTCILWEHTTDKS